MDDLGLGRRYCSVCGSLSSEPLSACPQCSLATSRVPQVAPAPVLYQDRRMLPEARAGPPAWAVILLLVALATATILATLWADGAFSSAMVMAPGELAARTLAVVARAPL